MTHCPSVLPCDQQRHFLHKFLTSDKREERGKKEEKREGKREEREREREKRGRTENVRELKRESTNIRFLHYLYRYIFCLPLE